PSQDIASAIANPAARTARCHSPASASPTAPSIITRIARPSPAAWRELWSLETTLLSRFTRRLLSRQLPLHVCYSHDRSALLLHGNLLTAFPFVRAQPAGRATASSSSARSATRKVEARRSAGRKSPAIVTVTLPQTSYNSQHPSTHKLPSTN